LPITLIVGLGDSAGTCVSCPGDQKRETGACHTWNCNGSPGPHSDRNDCFFINETFNAFTLYSCPAQMIPTGPGLMSPGKCLVPESPGPLSNVRAVQCSDIPTDSRVWSYNSTSKLLQHKESGLYLDAGSPFELNCWTPSSPTFDYPMCDTRRSAEERARDFVSRMTLQEKGQNLGGVGGWGGSAGVPRLGIPKPSALQSSEALHGLAQASCGQTYYYKEFGGNNTGCPTSFPHALALGATFNRTLWALVGDRISTEARAAFNSGHLKALWLWAPDINLFRDPRYSKKLAETKN